MAGVGVRGSGMGVINMAGVSSGAEVLAAFLYWETLGNGQNGSFRGAPISGTPLGTVVSPCWPQPTITVYRADVLSLLLVDASGRPVANGSHSVSFPDSGNPSVAPSTEGASLVVVFKSEALPAKFVALYDGAFTIPTDGASNNGSSFNLAINGFPPATDSPQARIAYVVGDGQDFDDRLFFNGVSLGANVFSGSQGAMWDNPVFNVGGLIPAGSTEVTTSSPIVSDCLTWGAVVFSIMVGGPKIQISLEPAPANDQYVIDATPMMPLIQARAKVINVTPDPTPTTTFTWKVDLTVEKGTGEQVSYASDILQDVTTTGSALFIVSFKDSSAFRGGKLKLTATATVNSKTLEGTTPGDLVIEGENPQRADIQEAINQAVPPDGFFGLFTGDIQDVLKRIACQESRQKEFDAAANGGIGPPLVFPDNGVGIFQITSITACPNPFVKCPNTLFSWPINVVAGRVAFQEKVGIAKRYPAQLKANRRYRDFITDTVNPDRATAGLKPIPGFPAPSFTTVGPIGVLSPLNQLLRDAVRGYNGYGGTSPIAFGLLLHEFVPDRMFLETVPDAQLAELNTNPNVWRTVTLSERKTVQSFGLNYVSDVKSRSPQCGD